MKLDEREALQRLADCGIKKDGGMLRLLPKGPGIRLWAVIDFLTKQHGYEWTRA